MADIESFNIGSDNMADVLVIKWWISTTPTTLRPVFGHVITALCCIHNYIVICEVIKYVFCSVLHCQSTATIKPKMAFVFF